jgi:hypothetical protein
MPYRPSPVAPVPTYRAYHFSAATTQAAALGMLLDATATVVSAPGSATVTLTILDGDLGAVQPGIDLLICDTGASCEAAPITSINPAAKQLTATFANTHSNGFACRVSRGSYLGGLTFNTAGSGMTLTLYNGHPNNGGHPFAAIIPPAAAMPFALACACDQGLFATYAGGTPGDLTILALPSL